ncbi:MAG: site-specific DNA-methyltransferase, partial [Verrucomicrobia bacterium]|nr:site-specific DNA-methyltransferase [Verrucomicrobiota bacterium]
WEDLLVFYHPTVLSQLTALKEYFLERESTGTFDSVDDWIRMVCLNRLTGHSPGFFSVYSLPPNQSASIASQKRINEKRNQTPGPKDLVAIILKKSRQLLGDVQGPALENLAAVRDQALFITAPCSSTPKIASNSIDLVVTSPPFLNVIQYAEDNWLRCWFIGFDAQKLGITFTGSLKEWRRVMTEVLGELRRVLKPEGRIAFEVGEVQGGKTRLEESVTPCAMDAGLRAELVLINDQEFTKTANCWGVDNNGKGTNTNRIVVLAKD